MIAWMMALMSPLLKAPTRTWHPSRIKRSVSARATSGFICVSPGNQDKLGAAHGLDASGGVDVVHGQLVGLPGRFSDDGQDARHGLD
ncbi:MAG: hypothetical protein MZW92_27360 [Comamonadaceae bacterium]|nr:hypothetical protein [Comamonadaceae bacterium]